MPGWEGPSTFDSKIRHLLTFIYNYTNYTTDLAMNYGKPWISGGTSAGPSSTVTPGQWFHVAAGWDGSKSFVYLNGLKVQEQALQPPRGGRRRPFAGLRPRALPRLRRVAPGGVRVQGPRLLPELPRPANE